MGLQSSEGPNQLQRGGVRSRQQLLLLELLQHQHMKSISNFLHCFSYINITADSGDVTSSTQLVAILKSLCGEGVEGLQKFDSEKSQLTEKQQHNHHALRCLLTLMLHHSVSTVNTHTHTRSMLGKAHTRAKPKPIHNQSAELSRAQTCVPSVCRHPQGVTSQKVTRAPPAPPLTLPPLEHLR